MANNELVVAKSLETSIPEVQPANINTEDLSTIPDVSKNDFFWVPWRLLRVKPGFNVRRNMGDIPGLAGEIKENGGVIYPVTGWTENEDGKKVYYLKDGHRRFLAGKYLWETEQYEIRVKFFIQPRSTSPDQMILDMLLAPGKPLTPLERAEGVNRLIKEGYTYKEICAKLSIKAVATIKKMELLASAPKRLKIMMDNEQVTADIVADVLSIADDETRELKIAELIQMGGALNTSGFEDAELVGDEESEDGEKPTQPVKLKKVKRSEILQQSSLTIFKRLMKNIDDLEVNEVKKPYITFFKQLLADELIEEDIIRWLKTKGNVKGKNQTVAVAE